MLLKTIKSITQSDLKTEQLTGVFITSDDMGIQEFSVVKNSYIFLKNSILHNELGPAVISDLSLNNAVTVWYFKDGAFHIAPKPFSALGFNYLISPCEVDLRSFPKWNGSQFIYDNSEICGYQFLNSNKELHCEHGPAYIVSNFYFEVKDLGYYLEGKGYPKENYEIELNKRSVLEIIKLS